MNKTNIEETIHGFKNSMTSKVELGGLLARSDVAHKWQLTYRLAVVREAICRRLIDILEQALYLSKNDMIVGARIMSRAGLETLCLLIYINKRTKQVVDNKLSFNDYEELTRRFLLGAKNNSDMPNPLNVSKYIHESEKIYTGIEEIYNTLCETAHPNYEGICQGYTKNIYDRHETIFGVFWNEIFPNQHEVAIEICLNIFEHEYNEVWPERFENLEKWLEKNDTKLQRNYNKKQKANK